MKNYNNKRPVETILVRKFADANLWATEDGTSLVTANTATLTEGQLALASAVGSTANKIVDFTGESLIPSGSFFVQGTSASSNPGTAYRTATYPLYEPAFLASQVLHPGLTVTATKRNYLAPTNSVWVVGDTGAVATGGINVADETEYALTIAYRGRIVDQLYSSQATAFYTPSFVTPDYTTLGTTNPLDHLIQHLLWDVNRSSMAIGFNNEGNEPIVGLALDLSGVAGQAVAGLSAGFLPLVNTSLGVRGITLDANMVATLQAALPVGSSIMTIDLSTAGTAANGADAIAIVALDRRVAFVDDLPSVKIDFDLGLRYGFNVDTVHTEQTSFPNEGQNTVRYLEREYQATVGQRRYSQDHEEFPIIKFPSPLEDIAYNRIDIVGVAHNQVDTFNVVQAPQRTVLLFPDGVTNSDADYDAL
jgi:hypothetical protein